MFKASYRSTPRRRRERAMHLAAGAPVAATSGQRRCSQPDCDAVLSRYNPADSCCLHDGWQPPRAPGRRPRRHVL